MPSMADDVTPLAAGTLVGSVVSPTATETNLVQLNPSSSNGIGVPGPHASSSQTTTVSEALRTETVVVPPPDDKTSTPPPPPPSTPTPTPTPTLTRTKTPAGQNGAGSTTTDLPTFAPSTTTATRTTTTVTYTPPSHLPQAAATSTARSTTLRSTSTSTSSTTTRTTRSATGTTPTAKATSTDEHNVETTLSYATDTVDPHGGVGAAAEDPTSQAPKPSASRGSGKTGKEGAEGGVEVGHRSAGGDVNIGMIIGIVAAVLVVIGIVIFAWSRWRKSKKKKEELQILNDEDDLDDTKSEFSSGRPPSDRQTYMSGLSTGDPRARDTMYTDYDSRRTYAETDLLDGKSYRYDIDRDTLVTKAPRSSYWAGPETGRTTTTAFTQWAEPETSVPPVPHLPSAFLKESQTTARPTTQMTSYGGLLSAYGGASYGAQEASAPASRPASVLSTMTENLLPWLRKEPAATPALPTTSDAFTPQGRSHKPPSRPISFRRLTGERVSTPPTAPPPVRPPPVPAMAQTPMAVTTRMGGYDGPMPAFR